MQVSGKLDEFVSKNNVMELFLVINSSKEVILLAIISMGKFAMFQQQKDCLHRYIQCKEIYYLSEYHNMWSGLLHMTIYIAQTDEYGTVNIAQLRNVKVQSIVVVPVVFTGSYCCR